MPDNVENFVERFIEKQELTVHYGVFDHEFIQELDSAIESGPHSVRIVYRNYAETLDSESLSEITDEISNRNREHLNESDLQIINFFTSEATQPGIKEIIDITGVIVNVIELIDEIKLKSYSITPNIESTAYTPNIESTAYFWLYLNVYELILDTMTKNLLNYYQEEEKREGQIPELKEKVENGEHLTTGELKGELVGLNVIEHQNDSIFSQERARAMRNKLGHANVFHDDNKGEIVFTDGERYSYEEFKQEFEVILQFTLEWAYQLNDQSSAVDSAIKEGFEAMSEEIDRKLLRFSRSDGDWEKVLLRILDEEDSE